MARDVSLCFNCQSIADDFFLQNIIKIMWGIKRKRRSCKTEVQYFNYYIQQTRKLSCQNFLNTSTQSGLTVNQNPVREPLAYSREHSLSQQYQSLSRLWMAGDGASLRPSKEILRYGDVTHATDTAELPRHRCPASNSPFTELWWTLVSTSSHVGVISCHLGDRT